MPDGNGSIVAARLSDDFTKLLTEPRHLFYARDAAWARTGVTDGPFLYRTDGGKLFMTWSNYGKKEYVVALASSPSGELFGPWVQEGLIYEKGMLKGEPYDGGHGMIFRRHDGTLMLSFHAANKPEENDIREHLVLLPIAEADGILKLIEN